MIRYSLVCDRDHAFDGWFASSSAYDAQAERGLISCPSCGSVKIAKAIMAPSIACKTPESGAPLPARASMPAALPGGKDVALREMIRGLRAEIARTAQDVGDRFAEEARRIHYGEADGTAIYGRATPEEARALAVEGVGFLPLPLLPEEQN